MWTGERARVGAGIYSAWKETAAPPISIPTDQNIFANVATLGSVLANGTRTTDHESDGQPFFCYRGHAGLASWPQRIYTLIQNGSSALIWNCGWTSDQYNRQLQFCTGWNIHPSEQRSLRRKTFLGAAGNTM